MQDHLHILGPEFSTFVRSVRLCCEEKKLTYSVGTTFNEHTVELGHESIYQYHPFGRVPVLIHNVQHYFETVVICRYLDAYFGGISLQPESLQERTIVEQWAHCLALYVDHTFVRQYLLEFAFPKGPDGTLRIAEIKNIEPEVIRLIQYLDHEMGTKEFFKTSCFSIADAILIPMLDYLDKLPHSARLFKDQKYLLPYLERARQRDSGKKVLVEISR